MMLPAMHGDVDPAVLAALPPLMQLDLLVQIRERLMAENRQKYQKVKKDSPKLNGGCFVHDVTASSSINSQGLTASSQGSLISNGSNGLADVNFSNERMNKVYQHGRMAMGQSSSQGFHSLTQIPSKGPKDANGNVHTGALPPWFSADEESQLSIPLQRVSATLLPLSNQAGKSKKLNPK